MQIVKKGLIAVIAAQRIRVGRCHGSRYFERPRVPSWRLWLACGHMEVRRAKNPPKSVKCSRCEYGYLKDYEKGEIPDDFTIMRF